MTSKSTTQPTSFSSPTLTAEERVLVQRLIDKLPSDGSTFITEELLRSIAPEKGSMAWMRLIFTAGELGLIHRTRVGYMLDTKS